LGNANIAPTHTGTPAKPINAKKPASADNEVSVGADGKVTRLAAGPGGANVIEREVGREEKVEYRDQDGNLLNEEQVSALSGKVSFSTRYETRTRLVDAAGKEINSGAPEPPVAPPHPDVEGSDPETIPSEEQVRSEKNTPASPENVASDIKKEKAVQKKAGKSGAAEPEAEAAAET
jgi:dolichyl-phosphate-mannose-protein mannosyltransferase